jgi:hypothetical protein
MRWRLPFFAARRGMFTRKVPDPVKKPDLIPTDALANGPMSTPKLAPDGLHIAARMNVKGAENLAILAVRDEAPILIPIGQKKGDPTCAGIVGRAIARC